MASNKQKQEQKFRHGRPIVFENNHIRVILNHDGSVSVEEAVADAQSGPTIVFGEKRGAGITFTINTHSRIEPVIVNGAIAWRIHFG